MSGDRLPLAKLAEASEGEASGTEASEAEVRGTEITLAGQLDLDAIMAIDADGDWSSKQWREELCGDFRRVFAIRDSASTELLGVASFRAIVDEAELLRIVVSPSYRRRGLAAQLCAFGIDWCQLNGVAKLFLEVDATNFPAIGLYEKFGFEEIARRPNYYGPGREAVIMQRVLGEGLGEGIRKGLAEVVGEEK